MNAYHFEIHYRRDLQRAKSLRVLIVADDEEEAKGEMVAQYPNASHIFLLYAFDEMILPEHWTDDDDTDDETGEDWPGDDPDDPQPHEEKTVFAYN